MSVLGNVAVSSGSSKGPVPRPDPFGAVDRPPAPPPRPTLQAPRAQYVELKASVHRRLLNRLNLEALANSDRARAESEIRTLVGELLAEEGAPLSLSEREVLLGELLDEVFGLGPLEPLLRDPSASRASTSGELSSIRRPTALTIRSITRSK